jgi:ABC-type glycerol-3-phosphate transport system permease component
MTRSQEVTHPPASRSRGIWAWLRGHHAIWTSSFQIGCLSVILFFAFVPILMMLSMALRPTVLIYADYWGLPIRPTLQNFHVALLDLFPSMIRTLVIGVGSIVGILAFAAPASYAFARIHAPGRGQFFLIILAVMMIPGIVLLVPHFVLARQLHLVRTFHGLIIFYIAGGQPFAIFLITTFFRSQPSEMFESARVDGASELQSLLHIALPLARPILVTVAVMNFIGIYQDFIWPGLMLRSDQWTLMLALEQYDPRQNIFFSRPELGLQAAGFAFAVIPQLILFSFGMQYFIQGLTSGSVKG